jgi:hypothetical protein
MRHLNIKNITIPLFVITLALGALTILFTPDTVQAGTCECTLPPDPAAGHLPVGYRPSAQSCYNMGCSSCAIISKTFSCQCETGCRLYGNGNSCQSGYSASDKLCWFAFVVWSSKKVCTQSVQRRTLVCTSCRDGKRLSDGRCR